MNLHDRRRFASTDARSDVQPLRLLVIDDDPNYRAYVAALTRRLGFVVESAADGAEGLDILAMRPFDVAIVDQEMPRLTGLEVIERIRAVEATKGMYTLMLTGLEDTETKLSALNAGFDDFVNKTSSEAELLAKLAAARRLAARQRTLDAVVRELYGLATRDELTSVFNRRFFVNETERLLREGIGVSVVLFDLDNFKHINDTFGHLAGDRVLRDVGALFQRNTRPEDLIARYGGDEFVMVVASLPLTDVERIAERLTTDLASLQWIFDVESISIGATTGVSSSQLLPHATVEQLLNAADRDLYKNKWIRHHPEERLELYEYPQEAGGSESVVPMRRVDLEELPRVAEKPGPER